MSTRCRIGVEHDGKIESIYCHHDGYLDYVGRKLQKYYNDIFSVRELMKLGDISSLGDNLPHEGLKFEDYTEGRFCRPYSLRGENCPSTFDDSIEQLLKHTEDCWGEYLYVFMKDYEGIYRWFVWEINSKIRLDFALEDLDRKRKE